MYKLYNWYFFKVKINKWGIFYYKKKYQKKNIKNDDRHVINEKFIVEKII